MLTTFRQSVQPWQSQRFHPGSGCLRPSCMVLGLRRLRFACGYHYFAFFFSFCYIYLGQLRGLTTVSRHDSCRILPPRREPKEREQNGRPIFQSIDGDEPASSCCRVHGRRAVWAAVLPFSRAPGRRTPNSRRLRKFTEMIQVLAAVLSSPIPHGWRTDLLSVDSSSRVHRRGAVRAPSVTGPVVYHSRDGPRHSVESCHHQEHIHDGTRDSSRSDIDTLKLCSCGRHNIVVVHLNPPAIRVMSRQHPGGCALARRPAIHWTSQSLVSPLPKSVPSEERRPLQGGLSLNELPHTPTICLSPIMSPTSRRPTHRLTPRTVDAVLQEMLGTHVPLGIVTAAIDYSQLGKFTIEVQKPRER